MNTHPSRFFSPDSASIHYANPLSITSGATKTSLQYMTAQDGTKMPAWPTIEAGYGQIIHKAI